MARVIARAYLDEWDGVARNEIPVETELSALLFALDRMDQRTHTEFGLECGTASESLLISGGLNLFIFCLFHADGTSSTLWKETSSLAEAPQITVGGQAADFDPLMVHSRQEARQALRDFLNEDEPQSGACWIKDF